jgi:4-alpha-glucanotransferase
MEEGNRTHRPDAIVQARQALVREVRFAQYLQWVADEQWRVARREAGDVMLLGDLPFMVSADSADVWARQHAFDLTASIGVPPDAFSASGQDWGLPVYRWDVIADEDYEWIHQRARRYADLYGGFRVDHLVGFYRTYAIPLDGSPRYFVPDTLRAQLQQGETIMGMFGSVGARVFAEDLGTVPDEVRESLARLKWPGYRVLRWEREWHKPGMPFRDPLAFPPISVATTGTHDTDTLAAWWDTADDRARRRARNAVVREPAIGARRVGRAAGGPITGRQGVAVGSPFSDEMRMRSSSCSLPAGQRTWSYAAGCSAGASRERAGDRRRPELDVDAAVADRRVGVASRVPRADARHRELVRQVPPPVNPGVPHA